MVEENIRTIDDLMAFMDEEAKKWGREKHDAPYVNGKGVLLQWDQRIKIPTPIFYMVGVQDEDDKIVFDTRSLWFDGNGKKTEKPESMF